MVVVDRVRKVLPKVVLHAILILFVVTTLAPMIWIVGSSFKSIPESYAVPTTLLPTEPTLRHYAFVLRSLTVLPRYYANSLVVTCSAVALSTMICCLAGYDFARLDFPGRDLIFWLLVISMFLPTSITSLFAVYELTDKLGLLDTRLGLILPYTAGSLIVGTFIMRATFQGVERALEDAARLDGANELQIFGTIMLPLAANGMVVIVILNFISIWGEYLLARTLTTEKARTLPVGITMVQPASGTEWHFPAVTAAYTLMFLPTFLVMSAMQKWFVKGLSEGAVKF